MGVDGVFPNLHSTERDRRTGHEYLELLTGWAMLEVALWTSGREQVVIGIVTIAAMATFNFAAGYTAKVQGFSLDANRRALWIVPCAALFSAAILASGYVAGTLHSPDSFRSPTWHVMGYFTWALIQEWMSLGFVFVRLERVLPQRNALLLCAVIFSLAHLPNLTLMAATFVMSAAFTLLFRRTRALYPLALAHAVFGLSVALAMPAWFTHAMRVGAAYFR